MDSKNEMMATRYLKVGIRPSTNSDGWWEVYVCARFSNDSWSRLSPMITELESESAARYWMEKFCEGKQ